MLLVTVIMQKGMDFAGSCSVASSSCSSAAMFMLPLKGAYTKRTNLSKFVGLTGKLMESQPPHVSVGKRTSSCRCMLFTRSSAVAPACSMLARVVSKWLLLGITLRPGSTRTCTAYELQM